MATRTVVSRETRSARPPTWAKRDVLTRLEETAGCKLGALAGGAESDCAATDVGGQRNVGLAIAEHEAFREVDRVTEQVWHDESRSGLSTLAAIVRVMRTDQDFVEVNSLTLQELEQQALWAFEFLARKHARAEPILVRHHDEAIPMLDEQFQSRHEAWLEADLLEAVHLLVGRLLDERSIAIGEHHPNQHAASRQLRIAETRRSLSSLRPT
jgi:hypothetical protein